ncbi:MAG: ATP-binding protein [Actinomycetota bacterium]
MTNRSIEPISHQQAIAGLSASLLIGGGVLLGDAILGRHQYQVNDPNGSICGAKRCQISEPKPSRFIEAAIGSLLVGCGVASSRYCSLGSDLLDLGKIGSGAVWEWVSEAVEELQPTETQQQRLIQIAVNAAPIQVLTWIQQTSADTSWFEKWLKGHNRIAGETDSGKTTLAEASLAHHLHWFPDSTVAICDINFGKRDKDWLGISPDYIYPDIEQIAAVIAHEYKELCDRRQRCITAKKSGKQPPQFSPRLLVVDELDSTAEDLGGKDSEPLKQLRAIAKQGLGYGLKLILIGQSLAVGETGISLATSKQFSSILIIKGKLPRSELTYLNPSNADELEEKVKQLQKTGHRIAIAQLGETTPEVVVVPDLSHLKNLRLSHRDPVADWWKSAWTSEVELWAIEQATRYVKGSIESPLKPLAKRLGIQTLNSDPRYSQYLKPQWEAILSSAKEGTRS